MHLKIFFKIILSRRNPMKNEDKVYLYSDGSMCRVINENDKTVKQVDHFVIRENLKILGSYNGNDNRMCFVLKDDNNRIYYMSQDDFNKYVEKHDIVLDSEFEFVRNGKTQSIREVEKVNSWIKVSEKVPEIELYSQIPSGRIYGVSKQLIKFKTFSGDEYLGVCFIYSTDAYFRVLETDEKISYKNVEYWKPFEK